AAMVIICEDKSKLDQNEAKRKIQYWQSIESPCFTRFHEWAYGGGNRKIIVEEFLDAGKGKPPEDYKIFCFNGEPKLIQVDFDRFDGHRRGFYDLDWQLLPFEWKVQAKQGACPPPRQLEKMLKIAKALSEDLPFARIDLYEIGDRVVFGEITLYPAAGYGRFVPDRYDEVVGDMLTLPDPIRP
ncbi:MAG: ATP-grasp fold amidoligase family protein, partial [Planctomycetota bacterium]